MNDYVVALLGLLAIFVVGFLVYGVLFKDSLRDNEVKLTPTRFVIAAVGMYVISLAFIRLYRDAGFFASGASDPVRGLYLGLLVGIAFFAIPLFADSPYLKVKDSVVRTLMINWVVAFAVLGLVVGWLIG